MSGEGGGGQSALETGGVESSPQNKNPKPIVEAIYLFYRSFYQFLSPPPPPQIIFSQASYTLKQNSRQSITDCGLNWTKLQLVSNTRLVRLLSEDWFIAKHSSLLH